MGNAYLKYVAHHEAGHAVASWAMQRELGHDWIHFHRVFIRTKEQAKAGPYIDYRGREVDCIGMLEGPSRYNSVRRPVADIEYVNMSPERTAEFKEMWQNMEADVVELLAGSIAEARRRRCSRFAAMLMGGMEDYEEAKAKVCDFHRNQDEITQVLGRLEQKASKVVRNHWSSVTALATALVDRMEIDGEEATAIIEAARA